MNFAKNQMINLKIEALSSEAYGIGRANGFVFFVPGAIPGEEVTARIIKLTKTYGVCKLEHIKAASPNRAEPECPVYKRCGGCSLSHMQYAAQLEYKTEKVLDALRVIGKFSADELPRKLETNPCVGMEFPFRYRNKVQMPAGIAGCKPSFGFYAPRSHSFIAVCDCLLCGAENKEILSLVLEFMEENNISVYYESRNDGLVRHAMIRTSRKTGEILLCLVLNGKKLPHHEKLIEKLKHRISGLLINVNTEETNVILGKKTLCLWGRDYITDSIGGIDFKISINSFYQVNPVQTELLYAKALEYASGGENNTALDIYCGIGTITQLLAGKFKKVYGIEAVPEAISDAKASAAQNGAGNAEFVLAKAEEAIFDFIEKGIAPDCVVVDPPRKGCDEKLLSALLKLKPEKIVYVSCSPATLARDLKVLAQGYELRKISVYDCFAQTAHVETAVLLSR
ncbi:MAG: 23S rRNA (uracil(1939)-C(5))-methyltransferase RlmD [Clostridiales bacterium]|jgi:23S rRNA (uracil1939-C5)-methyltransferase|nr:23S rRNA (uracil(1939)-C(5))-methyltransferase RlmD [Clostridiales bacterium]